jgi:Uma2 family endonuclease
MSSPDAQPATYQDLLAVPSNKVAEIIAGTLYVNPRPAPAHANAASVLGSDLNRAYQRGRGGPGGWFILDEPELHLGEHVLVPDIGGWRRERMPGLPTTSWFGVPPDWVCEVLSPSTAGLDRVKKMPVYAAHGVAFIWLVDPIGQTLEVFGLESQRWVLLSTHGGDEVIRAEPFPEVEISLSELWPPEP